MAGNSWQQPVAGEPSCGTWHDIAAPIDGWLYSETAPTANQFYTVTFPVGTAAGNIPTGTKKVKAFVYGATPSSAPGVGYIYYRPYGSSESAGIEARALLVACGGVQVDLPVDSSGRVQVACNPNTIDMYVSNAVAYLI